MYPEPRGKPGGQKVLTCKGSPTKHSMLISWAWAVVGVWEQVVTEARVTLCSKYIIQRALFIMFKFTCTWTTFFPEILPISTLTAPLSIKCRAEKRSCPPSTLWRETRSSLKKEKLTSLENVDSPTLAEKLLIHRSPQWQGGGRWQEPPSPSPHLSPLIPLQTLKCTKACPQTSSAKNTFAARCKSTKVSLCAHYVKVPSAHLLYRSSGRASAAYKSSQMSSFALTRQFCKLYVGNRRLGVLHVSPFHQF